MNIINKIAKAVVIFLAIPITVSSCGILPVEEEALVMPTVKPFVANEHKSAYAARGDLQKIQKVTGYFRPIEQAILSFEAGGRVIQNVYVEVGTPVKPGDLLAELYNEDISNAIFEKTIKIQKIKSELEYLEKMNNLDRDLANKNGQKFEISADYLNQKSTLESQLKLAELDLEKTNTELENTKIYSTIYGNVSAIRDYTYSTFFDKGDYLITVKDTSSTFLGIDRTQSKFFSEGDEVSVVIDSNEYTGEVKKYEEENTYCDYYILIENLPPDTEAGQSSSITVILEESKDTVYVPKAAVTTVEGKHIVYRLDEQGNKILTDVVVGLDTYEYIEILEGLTEGQHVSLD